MLVERFDYSLPADAIAQHPPQQRDGARLLAVRRSSFEHFGVRDFPRLLEQPSLVVVNDTRVRRARVIATKPSGGRVELLFLERCAAAAGAERWQTLAASNRPLRPGMELQAGGERIVVVAREAGGRVEVELQLQDAEAFFERVGRVPLPPYVRRPDVPRDAERYQTVFARELGSAAAPTAGLHLTPSLLEELRARGHEVASVTLHVGLGTFRPVKTRDLDDHPMHAEHFEVSRKLSEQVARARAARRPLVAVGTTVVRALESARDPARPGHVLPRAGSTSLLIQPGYRFSVVDGLLTNFHAPRSTLLALIAAFAGTERWREAYAEALRRGYRFLSYGDAMWLAERHCGPPGGPASAGAA